MKMYVPKRKKSREHKTLSLVCGGELIRLIDEAAARHGVSRNRMSNYILSRHFATDDRDVERLMFE